MHLMTLLQSSPYLSGQYKSLVSSQESTYLLRQLIQAYGPSLFAGALERLDMQRIIVQVKLLKTSGNMWFDKRNSPPHCMNRAELKLSSDETSIEG